MSERIGIVDYGASNIESVHQAVYAAGFDSEPVSTPEAVLAVDRIVLPGVGAAGSALANLREHGLDEALTEAVRRRGRPFLGICLGMQLLAESLHEYGEHQGLGWIGGRVVSLSDLCAADARVPHMGWNEIAPGPAGAPFFRPGAAKRQFYFAHSYTLLPDDPSIIAASADHGISLVAAIRTETAFATQFHLEKSQNAGQRLLADFLDWCP